MGDVWVYHEAQDASLCGQHALNALLQGPYFTPDTLAEIAHDMDRRERELMLANGADTEDAIKFLAEDSGNLNDAGFFSVEVLRQALERFGELKLLSAKSEDLSGTKDLTTEKGFVCNRQEHWFAIRKIGDVWYNLNSLNTKPEVIGSFYLAAMLDQLQADGYSVFVVRGDLPEEGSPDQEGFGKWHRSSELNRSSPARRGISTLSSEDAKRQKQDDYWTDLGGSGRTLGGEPSSQLQAAIAEEDEELAKAIALSLQER